MKNKISTHKIVECNAACTARIVGDRCAYNPGMICPVNPLEKSSLDDRDINELVKKIGYVVKSG